MQHNRAASLSAGCAQHSMHEHSRLLPRSAAGWGAPVPANGLREKHRHELLHILATGVQGIDDGHTRIIAGPQRPISGYPSASLCPPAYTERTSYCLQWDQCLMYGTAACKRHQEPMPTSVSTPLCLRCVAYAYPGQERVPSLDWVSICLASHDGLTGHKDLQERGLAFRHLWKPGADPAGKLWRV